MVDRIRRLGTRCRLNIDLIIYVFILVNYLEPTISSSNQNKNIDNEVYYVCIKFPKLLISIDYARTLYKGIWKPECIEKLAL